MWLKQVNVSGFQKSAYSLSWLSADFGFEVKMSVEQKLSIKYGEQ